MPLVTKQEHLSQTLQDIHNQNNRGPSKIEGPAEQLVSQIRDTALGLNVRERLSFIAAIQEECESICSAVDL